jgi:predicted nucleotidyltransferase
MRITEREKNVIIDAVVNVDPDAKIWLFGFRTDDSKKGGDIDIGILSLKIDVMEEIEIKQKMYDKIGEQKIDFVVSKDGKEAFFKYAVTKGILLNG